MYEELAGRLNTDPSIGYNPLAWYDHFRVSSENLFFSFSSIFSDVVHNRINTFVTAISNGNRIDWSTIQGIIGQVI